MDILPVWEDQDDIRLNMKSKTSKLARQINDYDKMGVWYLTFQLMLNAILLLSDRIRSGSYLHKNRTGR